LIGALSVLPPEALRLEGATAELLRGLGVRTIGMLLGLPRDQLAVRFGAGILLRIDQALGRVDEPVKFLVPRSAIKATLEFEGAVESLDAIGLAVRELVREVAGQLAVRGLGARELRLRFWPPYSPVVEKVVRLVRPSRDEAAIFKLVSCVLETLESSEGFIAAGVAVTSADRLGDEQVALIGGDEERDAAELDHLMERLRARMERCVEWGELVESNLPECAFRFREDVGGGSGNRQGDKERGRQGEAGMEFMGGEVPGNRPPPNPLTFGELSAGPGGEGVGGLRGRRGGVEVFRPLRLLREPREIGVIVRPSESREGEPVSFTDEGREVHRLVHVRGPERITGQWWQGRWKVRDYFDVLDVGGRRYWVFRVAQSGRWFLHGVFE
jgi:protein ImuB